MADISLQEAFSLTLERAKARNRVRQCPLFELEGKVLAQDLGVQKALPAFDNSAMDGYAIKRADLGKSVPLQGAILAGDSPEFELPEGVAYKIMTGAPTPQGCEAVIPFEEAILQGDRVQLPAEAKKGANIRRQGEELALGAPLLRRGDRLSPYRAALLASQGYSTLPVFAPLRIGVYSSGNELIEPWNRALEHQIYNSNGTMIFSVLRSFGFSPEYLGVLPDDLENLKAQMGGFGEYDAIFTTGGVSMGEADFMERALDSLGAEVLIHGIKVKPGRPLLVALLRETMVFALPGNPIAAAMHLHFLALSALKKMQGDRAHHLDYIYARLEGDLALKGNRSNAILGHLSEGRFFPTHGGKYGSGMLTPLSVSNAMLFAGEGVDGFKVGDLVKVIPFSAPFSEEPKRFFNL